MDEALTFKHHITKKISNSYAKLPQNKKHPPIPGPGDTTEHLVLSVCISHIDYCKSVLYGLPDCSIRKLQQSPKHVCMLSAKKRKERQHLPVL